MMVLLNYITAQKENTIRLFLILFGALIFIPFIGTTHLFDWDEINFAESAREMLVSDNYLDVQINYQAFWEKPPLFFWLQALSMKVFGVNEFAARFPNAIVGIISLIALFNIGNRLYNKQTGIIWVIVYVGSFFPFFYFKSGIIDPLFNLFIFLGIYQFFLFANQTAKKPLLNVFLSGLFIGLATLTKGPVALLIFLLTTAVFMVLNKTYKRFLNLKVILAFLSTFLFFGGLWFILQFLNGNYTVLVDFVEYMIRLLNEKDAGHGGFFGYHFVILFIGVFPASILAIRSMGKNIENETDQKSFKQWMVILFWVVILLFSIVRTKIVHYSSLCYFPLTFLAVTTINNILNGKIIFQKWMKIVIAFFALIWGAAIASLHFVEKNKQSIIDSGTIKDPFAVGNFQADVSWPLIISVIGILYILVMVYLLWFSKKLTVQLLGLFFASLFFLETVITMVVPRIEKYSQNAAISFYQEKTGEDCYVNTYGFKSYAHYFYFNVPDYSNEKSKNADWLLSGEADKTVYIVCKNTKQKEFEEHYPHFELTHEKNGFVFFKHQQTHDRR